MNCSKRGRPPLTERKPVRSKRNLLLMIFMAFTFYLTTGIFAQEEYRIVTHKGKVKVVKSDEIIELEEALNINLEKGDAIMAYQGSSIEIAYPGGSRNVFAGPFYAAVETLEQPFEKDKLSFFEKPGLWEGLEIIFDEEDAESAGTTKGPDTGSDVSFYDEIKKALAAVKIVDPRLPPGKEKEMTAALESSKLIFNALSEAKQVIVRALVHKHFGMNEKALLMIFTHYEEIRHQKDKRPEIELMEDTLFERYLPILITIHPNERKNIPNEIPIDAAKHTGYRFTANFKVWWLSFHFDGGKLEEIEKSFDSSLHPQSTFELEKKTTPQTSPGKEGYFFVVACSNWTQLEKFDSTEAARKELLGNSIKETTSTQVQDYGTVIIKISDKTTE